MPDGFYQNQYFEQLNRRLESIEKDVKSIKSNIAYIYGFAAAIGFGTSLVIEWVKNTFFHA